MVFIANNKANQEGCEGNAMFLITLELKKLTDKRLLALPRGHATFLLC